MFPTLVVLIAFIAVAGCCVYTGYRVGQAVSPTSGKLEGRIAWLEAAVAQSGRGIREAYERSREESVREAKRLSDDSARTSEGQALEVRRGLDDFGERLNGVRVDLARETMLLREEVQSTLVRLHEEIEAGLVRMRERAHQETSELTRLQREALAGIPSQVKELESDRERRDERAKAAIEAIGSDLKASYASSAGELRERLAADLAEVRATVTQLGETVAVHGARLEGVDQTFRTALQESAGKHDALNGAVEAQLLMFRAETSEQLAQLRSADERLESSWGQLRTDFEVITRSVVQINRAVDVLKSELTVKVQDAGASTQVDGLFERVLQPGEFERDVEIEPGTNQRVAFAVRLSDNPVTRVWLPIGTLPAVQGYNELVAATVYSDVDGIRSSSETFERAILAAAGELGAKFVCPPRTLNLAVLLVPTDDLFAEIVRRDSLVDTVRRNFHVVIAGPATLPTLLTGLRMAFLGTSAATANLPNGPLGPRLAAEGD